MGNVGFQVCLVTFGLLLITASGCGGDGVTHIPDATGVPVPPTGAEPTLMPSPGSTSMPPSSPAPGAGSGSTVAATLTPGDASVSPADEEKGYALYMPGLSLGPISESFEARDRVDETFPEELRELFESQGFAPAWFSYRPTGGYAGPEAVYSAGDTGQHLDLSVRALDEQVRGLIDAWQRENSESSQPQIVIVSHSLGGAVAARWASDAKTEVLDSIRAVFTFDSPLLGIEAIREFFAGDAGDDLSNLVDEPARLLHFASRLDFAQIANTEDSIVLFEESFSANAWRVLSVTCERLVDLGDHKCVLEEPATLAFVGEVLRDSPPLWSGFVERPEVYRSMAGLGSLASLEPGTIITVAGGGVGDGFPTASPLLYGRPVGVAVDGDGNLFIADRGSHRVRRVRAVSSIITTVAGTGEGGFSGDGLRAATLMLDEPAGVAADREGNIFIADRGNHRIRRVEAVTGIMTTVAGTGEGGFNGDGSSATVMLNAPAGVAVDGPGNVFIADSDNNRIRRVDAVTGIITTIAGTGECCFGGDGFRATSGLLNEPVGIAIDQAGNLFIADRGNHRIRRVDAITSIITTVAGTRENGFSGDEGSATVAELDQPAGVAVDGVGNLFVADQGNDRIRRVDAVTGIITTVEEIAKPSGVAVDGAGNLYIAKEVAEIRFPGDRGPISYTSLDQPYGVAVDGTGNLFIADTRHSRIRKVDAATGIPTTVSITISRRLGLPYGVAVDGAGNIFVADRTPSRILRMDATTGIVTTVAGERKMCEQGVLGDGRNPLMFSALDRPKGIAVDGEGNLFVADTKNLRICRVSEATGKIAIVAGTGYREGEKGDGGHATDASLLEPTGVAVDGLGNLFIADRGRHRIRKVDAITGIITTVAGTGESGFSGDGGSAPDAELDRPTGVAVDEQGNLFIADAGNHRIRRVDAVTGIINTVAGTGQSGFSGDGGLATNAELDQPTGVAVDGAGNLFIVDHGNNRVRAVKAP